MRYSSIDVLRTVAIFIMVLVHFGENLSGYTPPISGLGAPLFCLLSGVSYCLWVRGHQARGTDDTLISKMSVRRGLFIFGVGLAFNFFVWLPEDLFIWDVLTFIGVALLVLNIARHAPLRISVLFAAAAVVISPLLRHSADYAAYWPSDHFEWDLTMSDILVGFLATGYFPVFPWIALSLSGFVAASMLFGRTVRDSEPESSPNAVALLGALMAAAGLLLYFARPFLPTVIATRMLGGWTMFPPTSEYVLTVLGLSLALLALAHRFIDRLPRTTRLGGALRIAKTFSRYSLTIYLVHHVVHLWPLWMHGMAAGQEPTYYWMKAMPIAASLPLAIVFLICCYAVLRWLGPERSYGVESAMRWLCDEPAAEETSR